VSAQAQAGAGNVTTAVNVATASLACNKPSNIADGDLLLCAGFFRNASGTITIPSGWTQIGVLNQTSGTWGTWYKPIPLASVESGTSSYTFSTSAGSGRTLLGITRITGANLSSVEDSTGAEALYTGTTSISLPALTAISNDALLLAFAINNATATVSNLTADGAMGEVFQTNVTNGTTASTAIQLAQQDLAAAGSTGTRTPTISPSASNSGGYLIAISPAIQGRSPRILTMTSAQFRAANY
jgi:hypothetical protein